MQPAIYGACLHAGQAMLVRVECLIERGLPRVQVVGMADLATREARERLPAAFAAQGLQFPKSRVLFNLLPAQIPKRGLPLDLALAAAVLAQRGLLQSAQQAQSAPIVCLGEIDLAGSVHAPARGALLVAAAARALSPRSQVLVPPQCAREAKLVSNINVIAIEQLRQLSDAGNKEATPHRSAVTPSAASPAAATSTATATSHVAARVHSSFDSIRGQELARQAAIYACAGGHTLLLQGPPGTGKSMLARSLVELLPDLSQTAALELAQVEALHRPVRALPRQVPFRAPHHSISAQALLGGGRPLHAGEISRAHGGLLFLDELPEFTRPCLEGLRQPLEEYEVRVERTGESACFPADCMLVAARNPCPCGFASHPEQACTCTPAQVARYQQRTSGPLLDRFDIFVEMGPVPAQVLTGPATSPTLEEARATVRRARQFQSKRRRTFGWASPARASREQLTQLGLDPLATAALQQAADKLQWSGRGLLRCLRLARTIADTKRCSTIQRAHVLAALRFRPPRQSLLVHA